MALFFDASWFEARLAERGLDRAALANAGAMSEADLGLVFKDQRELSAAEVAAFAQALGVGAAEIASHAGVSTPTPRLDRLARIEARLERIEALLAKLTGG
jgi:hypothetical protein